MANRNIPSCTTVKSTSTHYSRPRLVKSRYRHRLRVNIESCKSRLTAHNTKCPKNSPTPQSTSCKTSTMTAGHSLSTSRTNFIQRNQRSNRPAWRKMERRPDQSPRISGRPGPPNSIRSLDRHHAAQKPGGFFQHPTKSPTASWQWPSSTNYLMKT